MKQLTYISILLTICLACSKTVTDEPPQVKSAVRVTSQMSKAVRQSSGTTGSPAFAFWLGNQYLSHLDKATPDGTSIEPYFVSYPEEEIDAYKTEPYNTGNLYLNERWIYANGFYPSSLTPLKTGDQKDWSQLVIPENVQGYSDVLVTRGSISGNEANPLHENGTLTFVTRQSRVNFYARLGNISSGRYFKGAKVSVNGKGIFSTRLKWSNGGTAGVITDDSYITADQVAEEDVVWTAVDPNTNQMDPNEYDNDAERYNEYRYIGTVYIHPGISSSITFDLQVSISESPLFDTFDYLSQSGNTVGFIDNNTGDAIILKEQEEYDILITINHDSFAIKGNKSEWIIGDNLIIPVPVKAAGIK